MSAARALSERELNDYLAACETVSGEELLDVKAANGVSLRDILTEATVHCVVTMDQEPDPLYADLFLAPGALLPASVTVVLEDVAPETMALMTGVHPATFDPEGRALVQGILDKKAEQ